MKDLFTSIPWMILVGVLLLVLAAFVVKGSASTYYFKYYVHNESLVAPSCCRTAWRSCSDGRYHSIDKDIRQEAALHHLYRGGGLVIGGFCLPGSTISR